MIAAWIDLRMRPWMGFRPLIMVGRGPRRDQNEARKVPALSRLEIDLIAGRMPQATTGNEALSSSLWRCATSASRKPGQRAQL
jgi:hypothetical protein